MGRNIRRIVTPVRTYTPPSIPPEIHSYRLKVTFLSLILSLCIIGYSAYNIYLIYNLYVDYDDLLPEIYTTNGDSVCAVGVDPNQVDDAAEFDSPEDVEKLIKEIPEDYCLKYFIYFWGGLTSILMLVKLIIKCSSVCGANNRFNWKMMKYYECWPRNAEYRFLLAHFLLLVAMLVVSIPVIYIDYDLCLLLKIDVFMINNWFYLMYLAPLALILLLIQGFYIYCSEGEYDTPNTESNAPSQGCCKAIFSHVLTFIIFGTTMLAALTSVSMLLTWIFQYGYGGNAGIVLNFSAHFIDSFISPCKLFCMVSKTQESVKNPEYEDDRCETE